MSYTSIVDSVLESPYYMRTERQLKKAREFIQQSYAAAKINYKAKAATHEYDNYGARQWGALGFLVSSAMVYPMERMKVLQQVDILPEIRNEKGQYPFQDNFKAYIETHKEENRGFSLFRGFGTKFMKFLVKETAIFSLSDYIRENLQQFNEKTQPLSYFINSVIGGCVAGATIELLVYPLEVAKTRLICDAAPPDSRVYSSIWSTLTQDSKFSIKYVYNGAFFSLIGAALYRGIQLGIYESALYLGLENKSPLLQIPVAVFATMFAQKVTFPFDMIRRLLMVQNTPFEVTSADVHTIIKRMKHPQRQKDLARGWNMQFYTSLTAGLLLFSYRAIVDSATFAVNTGLSALE